MPPSSSSFLPARPLRVSGKFHLTHPLIAVIFAVLGLGILGGLGYLAFDEAKGLLDNERIWRDGVPAVWVEVHGKESTQKAIFHDYSLTVSYQDQGGREYEKKLEFHTCLSSVDQRTEPVVHYLAADPERFALSWAHDVRTGRWGSVALFGGMGLFLGGGLIVFGIAKTREYTAATTCAQESDEILLTVTKVEPYIIQQKEKGMTYHYTGEAPTGQPVTGKVTFLTKHPALFVDTAGQRLVALVNLKAKKKVVVLRHDFYPFVLGEDEKLHVQSALAEFRQKSGGGNG